MNLVKAVKAFFAILLDSNQARRFENAAALETENQKLRRELENKAVEARLAPPKEDKPADETQLRELGACALLQLLQQQARFLDFVQEDIDELSDEQVGAVSRGVHTDLRGAFEQYIRVEPVLNGSEGSAIDVSEAMQPYEYTVASNKDHKPPFKAVLQHHGWVLVRLNLPKREKPEAQKVLMPAQLEA